LHLDLWTSNCTAFDVYLINTSPTTVEQKVTLTPTLSGWNSFDILLSQYNTLALHNIGQLKLVSTPFGGANVYLDNIYFWKSATTPTLSAFSIPTKNNGDAPFTITAPTSNSSGAFTYTSSNTSVATVSGSTITVVGVGYSYITATQAASGSYGAGTISTTLQVNTGLPTTPTVAATTPTKASTDVISLYSNPYTNRTVDTWSASWDQADVQDATVAGNDVKKYTNLTFAGIEFTSSTINATAMQYFHIDIWSPNATSFKVKLVDFGANGVWNGPGSDDVEHEYTCIAPTFSSWVSYDIPLADFTGLTTRAHLAQLILSSSTSTVYVDNIYFWKNTTAPVSLIDFSAMKSNDNVLLQWKTTSELDNKGFAVERTSDGITWSELAFLSGHNNSNVINTYSFTDNAPLKGNNYYRLKQLDNNGKSTYSAIKLVKFGSKQLAISYYPNPVKNNLSVLIDFEKTNNATLSLVNTEGKIVKNISLENYTSGSVVSISVQNLARGIYYLVLNDLTNKQTEKVIVE